MCYKLQIMFSRTKAKIGSPKFQIRICTIVQIQIQNVEYSKYDFVNWLRLD